ncbi:MAG TPA: lysophospholipid acyltransferase family protein [Acidobacteriaceae bacterium]|nr:lysophospholipid acyltransferase family protein [Acidobacteriaceae bacterium]
MSLLRTIWRAAKVVTVFAVQLTKLVVMRPHTRPERAAWLTGFCRQALRTVNVSWVAEGLVPMEGAVITNHLSYLDIVVHAAIRPCVFVSAIETRKMPLIGWISMMAGTVYVERGGGGSAEKAAKGMAKGFRDGLPVVFFPEGGTFIGDEPVMPFHSGLLAEALEAEAPVWPGFIRYEVSEADRAEGKSARNDVHWSTQTLLAHLWNFLGLRGVQAEVRFAEEPVEFSRAAYEDRKVAAAEAREAVRKAGISDQGSGIRDQGPGIRDDQGSVCRGLPEQLRGQKS